MIKNVWNIAMKIDRGMEMKREDLKDGMKVIDTDDGMVMKYVKTDKSDYFVTEGNKWHTCQFDLSTFEPYTIKEE